MFQSWRFTYFLSFECKEERVLCATAVTTTVVYPLHVPLRPEFGCWPKAGSPHTFNSEMLYHPRDVGPSLLLLRMTITYAKMQIQIPWFKKLKMEPGTNQDMWLWITWPWPLNGWAACSRANCLGWTLFLHVLAVWHSGIFFPSCQTVEREWSGFYHIGLKRSLRVKSGKQHAM